MVPEFLECPLCFEPFSKVVETPCCHRCYCVDCLNQWLQKSNEKSCPGCRTKLESIDNCVPNIPFQRLADELPALCSYADKGCKDKITRGILVDHIKGCGYRSVCCEYGKEKCPQLLKKDLAEHQEICPWKPTTCPLCSLVVVLNQIESHQTTTCPMGKVTCSNPDCHDYITRGKLQEHLENDCAFQNAPCPFSPYGCKFEDLRGKMDHHLQEVALDHLKIALIQLKKKDHYNSRLLEKVDELQKKNFDLVSGIEQLSVLKPHLVTSPLSSLPVVLPSFLVEQNNKQVNIYGENRNKAGLKSKPGNTFSLFGGSEKQPDSSAVIISADRPIPPLLSKFTNIPYYFEVTILKLGPGEDSISIGFVGEGDTMKGALGLSPHSYGLNIIQQKTYNSGKGKPYPGMYHNTGVYGCGWDQNSGLIFFTVEGIVGGTAFKEVKGKLKPAISLSGPGTEVLVNFGTLQWAFHAKDWNLFHELEKKVEECEENGLCSYFATSTLYFPQYMFGCKTCDLVGHLGMCEVCAQVCHAGHDLIPAKLSPQFFCDCGNLTESKKRIMCKCLKQ